ncbi:MAG: hypothetical protein J7L96_03065 [Bacteroidales bacterium]|nr:hypothetical protein [Bacteroidales bacterium]
MFDSKKNDSLDSNLYGTWSYTSTDGVTSYTFSSDGTCVQVLYGVSYNWKWAIEDGKLKLYIDSGIPTYKTYKIEGNLLYIWVDSISDWGLPFTKQ